MFSELEHDKEQLKRIKGKVESDSWKVRITWNHLHLIPKIQDCLLLMKLLLSENYHLRLKAKILLNPEYNQEEWEGTDVNLCQQLVDEHGWDSDK